MKIVFMEADTLGTDMDLSMFREFGEVVVYGASDPAKNAERVRDADIIIVNKIPMNKEVLDRAEKLKLICITGTGTNIVDFLYVNARGIAVTNVKGYSTMAVAQHTFALLFYLYEKLSYYDSYVKSGTYSESGMFSHFANRFRELADKTWGIIGLGQIGTKVAELAETFGCNVVYYSTSGKNNQSRWQRVEFDALLAESDIISIHAPLNAATEKLIDEAALMRMKKEAFLLNLGRGPIVDQKALAEALLSGQIAGAGLDVLEQEPPAADDPLLRIKDSTRLIITPHIAWAACETRARCVKEVYENIKAWREGGSRNVVRS